MAMKAATLAALLAVTSALSSADFPAEVQTMMASLVEEGRPLEFALWQAIQWGPGCSNFEGTTDQDENEAQCNAVAGCAWQSQGEVPRYFAGGQEQWYLEHAYSRDNNGDFPPAGTDLSQFDLRYMYVKAGQSLDDVDDSASRGCLPENYTQQLAQIDYDVDTYFYRQLVCLNISATGVKSGKGTSDLAAACNDEVGCQYADAYGECNPDPALMGTCADPLHPRYNGGTACKPNTPTDAPTAAPTASPTSTPTAAPTASPTSTPTGAGSGDNFLTPPTGTESGAATVSVRIVYAVASVVLPLASSLLC